MDSALTDLAGQTYTVLQPYLHTLMSKASESVGTAVPAAVLRFWQLLSARTERTATPQMSPEALAGLLRSDALLHREAQHLVGTFGSTSATLTGDGAIAQGQRAIALGGGAVFVSNVDPKLSD